MFLRLLSCHGSLHGGRPCLRQLSAISVTKYKGFFSVALCYLPNAYGFIGSLGDCRAIGPTARHRNVECKYARSCLLAVFIESVVCAGRCGISCNGHKQKNHTFKDERNIRECRIITIFLWYKTGRNGNKLISLLSVFRFIVLFPFSAGETAETLSRYVIIISCPYYHRSILSTTQLLQ